MFIIRSTASAHSVMWAVLVVYATCALHISSAQVPWFVDSYEGSACKTPSGAAGVCKERDDCLVTLPNPVPVSEDAQGRALCGSVGPTALVCCGSRPATTSDVTSTTTTTAPRPSIVTSAPPVVIRTELPRTPVGDKSAQYCLSVISFNKQPWWTDDGHTRDNNDITPWWEEKEKYTPPKQVYWATGGVNRNHKELFPHMALLGYRLPGQTNTNWSCAGSLISDRFVLTAAHCLAEDNLKTLAVVRLGEYDLTADDRTEQDFGVDRTWVHPKEEPSTSLYHDIALVRLSRQVKFTHAVSPACLYTSPEGRDRKDGLVLSGWGMSDSIDWPRQVVLKGSAPLRVVPRNDCAKYYRQATHQVPRGIHPGMFCAVGRRRYVDTCQGDPGGPIQLKTSFDTYVIVGVATGGRRHCGDGTPDIYTRVAYYLDWIEYIVWPNGVAE